VAVSRSAGDDLDDLACPGLVHASADLMEPTATT
jgi:hypothetical protein